MGLTILPMSVEGNLGNIAGAGSDGVLRGALTATNPTKVFLKGIAQDTVLAYADDGGAYTDEGTEASEDTADDMTLLPATPANDDGEFGLVFHLLGLRGEHDLRLWANQGGRGFEEE